MLIDILKKFWSKLFKKSSSLTLNVQIIPAGNSHTFEEVLNTKTPFIRKPNIELDWECDVINDGRHSREIIAN